MALHDRENRWDDIAGILSEAGLVLGCTEFPLIIKQPDVPFPAFDTTYLHSQMAVDFIFRTPEVMESFSGVEEIELSRSGRLRRLSRIPFGSQVKQPAPHGVTEFPMTSGGLILGLGKLDYPTAS